MPILRKNLPPPLRARVLEGFSEKVPYGHTEFSNFLTWYLDFAEQRNCRKGKIVEDSILAQESLAILVKSRKPFTRTWKSKTFTDHTKLKIAF